MSKEQIVDFLDNLGWTDNPHLGDQSETWMLSPCETLEVIVYADGQWSLSRRNAEDSDEWDFAYGSPLHVIQEVAHVR
jgi:hypothetical protein